MQGFLNPQMLISIYCIDGPRNPLKVGFVQNNTATFRDAVKLTLCRPASRNELVWRQLADDCQCRRTPVSLKLPPWTCKLRHSSNRRHLGHSCRQVGTHCSHDLQQKPSTCRSDPVHFKQTSIWVLVGWERTAQFFNGSCAPIGVTSGYQGACAAKPDFWNSVTIPRSCRDCTWRRVAGEWGQSVGSVYCVGRHRLL